MNVGWAVSALLDYGVSVIHLSLNDSSTAEIKMDFLRILWDDPDDPEGNVEHIAEHGVSMSW